MEAIQAVTARTLKTGERLQLTIDPVADHVWTVDGTHNDLVTISKVSAGNIDTCTISGGRTVLKVIR